MIGQRAAEQHNEFTLLMSLVLDEEATEAEARALREHVTGCDACRRTWQRWQELDRRFTLAPMAPAPVDFSILVAARLDQRLEERRRRRWLVAGMAGSWVVAMFIAVLAVGLVNGWPLQVLSSSSALNAAWAGVSSIAAWLFRALADLVERMGAPTVAAGAGALLCLTCGLATIWLCMVARLSPTSDAQFVSAE
jgi:anti-sigma factor RsiW